MDIMLGMKMVEETKMSSAPSSSSSSLTKQVTTIDDYKVIVLDSDSPPFRFRTFSFNQAIPPLPDPDFSNPIILASVDGLVCVAYPTVEVRCKLQFVNPLTGMHKELPSFPSPPSFPLGISPADPVAFYRGVDGDYKLLWLLARGRHGAFVYSRNSDSWKRINFSVIRRKQELDDCHWSPYIFCPQDQCLYVELTCFNFDDDVLSSPFPYTTYSRVIRFDVKTETFREISVPRQIPVIGNTHEQHNSIASLILLDGCLHMNLLYIKHVEHPKEKGRYLTKHQVVLYKLNKDDDDDDDEWVKLDSFRGSDHEEASHHILTVSIGNSLAVLDADANSFKKMTTQQFRSQYHHFGIPSPQYTATHALCIPTRVVP